jgi:EAL and modified HD-GYP domain-containing signal transduction protein
MTTSMTTKQIENNLIPRLKEFFLARQPILNRDQHLIAYELLFRDANVGSASITDDRFATASVIAHASELGLHNVIGNSRGFVNVEESVLMSDFVNFLPANQIVLEILETAKVTDQLIARVAELAGAGYKFALDDVIRDSADLQRLMPWVSIIKIDISGMSKYDLSNISNQFIHNKKELLAEKVETQDQFQICMDLGFVYFQGYYFAKPVIISGKKLSPSQLAIVQLMSKLTSDADSIEIERSIKKDATLGLSLLKLVNTPAVGIGYRIESLKQALATLGRRQLQRWLQILLYSDASNPQQSGSPLLLLATTRGKLLELIAQHVEPKNRTMAETAFTVGMMSLMDTLFCLPTEKILEHIPVVDEIANALLHRTGFYGDLLKLAEYVEKIEENRDLLLPALKTLKLSTEDLNSMQLNAFEWSNALTNG